jgi:hypothetical protein
METGVYEVISQPINLNLMDKSKGNPAITESSSDFNQ